MPSSPCQFSWHSVRLCTLWSPPCSPFVTLTALSTFLFLLLPNELLINNSPSNANIHPTADRFFDEENDQRKEVPEQSSTLSWLSMAILPPKEQFSCGGGPFSFMAASLISISCHRDQIHLCCDHHDICYDQRNISQSFCDNIFCDCLSRIQSNPYCQNIAHPGLCLATRTFGHLFHWTSYCTSSDCAVTMAQLND